MGPPVYLVNYPTNNAWIVIITSTLVQTGSLLINHALEDLTIFTALAVAARVNA